MIIKKLSEDTYEVVEDELGYDYHIRLEGTKWIVDGFEGEDEEVATEEFDSFQEAIDFILEDGWRP